MTHNAESSPSLQHFNSTEPFEKAWNKEKKDGRNQSWWPSGSKNGSQATWVTSRLQLNKKGTHSTPVATFSRDLKGLVSVGNSCLVAGKDIPEVPQDCVLYTYHPMLSQKIKKGFGLSKVSTLTPADASGPMVWSTNAGTHKINGFIFKNKDGWWERLDSTRSAFLQEWRLMAPPPNRLVWSRQ